MNALLKLFVILGGIAASVPGHAAAPTTLTLDDLRDHPERWPASITVPRELQFQSGKLVKKGTLVKVGKLQGEQVVVDNQGGLVFDLPIAETDLIVRANEEWSKLTPAQREITAATLVEDRSLWPLRVQSFAEFRFNNETLKSGREFELQAITRTGVQLYSAEHNATLNTALPATDLIARARALALLSPAERPSRIAMAMRGQLTDVSGRAIEPASLEQAQVIALYYGASWCGPCRQFSPSLVKFVNRVAAENPRLAVVMLSNDKVDSALYGYMREENMPWPAITLSRVEKIPLLTGYAKSGIPQLVIVDRHGRILADSFKGSTYLGPQVAVQELEKILATGAAK